MRSTTARLARLLASWLGRLMAVATALAVAGTIVILFVLPRLTGGSALTVLTGSMTPGIPVGSLAFIRPVDPATLEVGDVATYQRESGVASYVTHRIVGIDPSSKPESFTFKGDANRGPDQDPVPGTAIRGELWFHVPYLGSIRDALHGRAGLTLLAMLTLGGYALLQVASEVRGRQRRRHQPATQHHVTCDQALVLVRLPRAAGQPLRGGIVLSLDGSESVLLYSTPSATLPDLLVELDGFHPRSIDVLDDRDTVLLEAAAAPLIGTLAGRGADHATT